MFQKYTLCGRTREIPRQSLYLRRPSWKTKSTISLIEYCEIYTCEQTAMQCWGPVKRSVFLAAEYKYIVLFRAQYKCFRVTSPQNTHALFKQRWETYTWQKPQLFREVINTHKTTSFCVPVNTAMLNALIDRNKLHYKKVCRTVGKKGHESWRNSALKKRFPNE